MSDMIKDILTCNCKEGYTIEKHGDDYALYFGRCNHKHGYNLAKISDIAHNCNLNNIECLLNKANAKD
jgi:hypothetical protein